MVKIYTLFQTITAKYPPPSPPFPGFDNIYVNEIMCDLQTYQVIGLIIDKGFKAGELKYLLYFVVSKNVWTFLGKPDVVISEDEEFKKVSFEKFASLKPVFQKENGMFDLSHCLDFKDGAYTVHAFCTSQDTRVTYMYGWCLLIQGCFFAV